MSEGQEKPPVAVKDRPAEKIGGHTPLKSQSTPSEQKILDKLSLHLEPATIQGDEGGQEKGREASERSKKCKFQLDEVLAKAQNLAERMAGRGWKELPKDLKEEYHSLKESGGEIFKEYFKATIDSSEWKELYQFLNPSLSNDDAEAARQAYEAHSAADRELGRIQSEDYKEVQAKYVPILNASKVRLIDYGLQPIIDTFASSHFGSSFDSILDYQFIKLGLPGRSSIQKRVSLLNTFESKKDTLLFQTIFGAGLIEKIKHETYEDAMKICFEHREDYSVSGQSDYWDRKAEAAEPQEAIAYLGRYPTPEVIRRLIAINAFDVRSQEEWSRGTGGRYTRTWKVGAAMRSLLTMKENSDWDKIVSQTVERYPEFKAFQEELRELQVREKLSSTSGFSNLSDLEYDYKIKYLTSLQLRLVDPPDDHDLASFLEEKPAIEIDDHKLEVLGLLSKNQYDALYQIPSDIRLDRNGGNPMEAPRAILSSKGVTPEQRDEAIERIKQIAFVSQVISKSGLIEDPYRVEGNAIRLFTFVLNPDLSQDEVEFVVKNYTNPFEAVKGQYGEHAGFEPLRQAVGTDPRYPLLMRAILEVDTGVFLRQGVADDWRAAFGKEGMKKWKETHSDGFVDKAGSLEWKEVYGNEGIIEWAKQAPDNFLERAGKQEWKDAFGDGPVERFLSALPKESDERRNAFLHNEYDRTTEFMKFLLKNNRQYKNFFSLTLQDFEIATEYVEQFGLSQDLHIFHYFRQISLLEKGIIAELPPEVARTGISTKKEMLDAIERMKTMAYGETPMTDLSQLTEFELDGLRIATGKASHRFDQGRPSFQRILSDFQDDIKAGRITPVPDGYMPETITLGNTKLEFDSTGITDDFERLTYDIRKGVEDVENFETNKFDLEELLTQKLKKIETTLKGAEGKKKDHLDKELSKFQTYYNSLDAVDSIDSLMATAVSMKMDKTERPQMNTILRQMIFKRVFGQNDHLRESLEQVLAGGRIAPEKILAVVNLIRDPIREHVINIKGGLEDYWTEETVQAMRENKDNLRDIFEPHYSSLAEAVENFQTTSGEGSTKVRVIPDRGFIGEMSGYLADVCYTAEYPLLAGRNVVPYKFVTIDKESKLPKFIGSVLVFEVNTKDGEGALMVRGFDVPQEENYEVSNFIEQFLDKMAETARARGKKRVLVPGNVGAISNYRQTINHIENRYVYSDAAVSLSERFAFNGYDLTNNSFVAREIS